MIKKGMKLYSIIYGVCPKCHEESMYVKSNPYALPDTLKIHPQCTHCHTKYRLEPSFFYGSMYVSYAVGIVFATMAFVVSRMLLSASLLSSFFAIVGTLLVFIPIIMRLSRNIWINLFMSYDESLAKSKKST